MIQAPTRLTLLLCLIIAPLVTQAQTPSVEARTATLARIESDYGDALMRRDPLLASQLGDKRFNDQLPDLSASAENAALASGQTFIQRLSEIDLTGLPDKIRRPADTLLTVLIAEQQSTSAKNWQNPTYQFLLLDARLTTLATKLPFPTVKDYDDYIARLKKLPTAFSQIMTNLQLGFEQGRTPDAATVAKVQAQVKVGASQPAESNPLATPLKRFPPALSPEERKRIATDLLDTIANDVIPAYNRVGRFVAARSNP